MRHGGDGWGGETGVRYSETIKGTPPSHWHPMALTSRLDRTQAGGRVYNATHPEPVNVAVVQRISPRVESREKDVI
jgi:hypothetical protein